MSKIQIIYSTRVELDLQEVCDELKIRMDQVQHITTAGNLLSIFMKDGRLHNYEFDFSRICDAEMDEWNPTTKIV